MTRSTKAALLSGLLFPGLGHLFLKCYLRGAILIVLAIVVMSILVRNAMKQALAIVDRINAGEIPVGAGGITEMIYGPAADGEGTTLGIAVFVLVICWIFGIVDSYRLGKKHNE